MGFEAVLRMEVGFSARARIRLDFDLCRAVALLGVVDEAAPLAVRLAAVLLVGHFTEGLAKRFLRPRLVLLRQLCGPVP